MTPDKSSEREAFEAWSVAWARKDDFGGALTDAEMMRRMDNGEYRYWPTECAWQAWQARAALPQQAQDIAEASGGAQGGPEEDRIEAAFWNFDARHKGYGQWKQAPMSERDAFKAEMRNALAAEKVRAEMRLVANGWRKPSAEAPAQSQETSLPPQGAADMLCDSNYIAGLKAGWNFCCADDHAGMQRAIEARIRDRVEWKAALAASPAPASLPPQWAASLLPEPDLLVDCAQGFVQGWSRTALSGLLAASPAPAPQEPAARFLLVAMDDDGCGNPVFCADEKAVRAALAPLLFFFNDEHPLSAEHDAEVDAQLEALLEDGFLRFEGDPGINLYKLHAPLYASPAPGELGACAHEWVSARNKVVASGEVCLKCFAIRAEAPSESSAQGSGGEKV